MQKVNKSTARKLYNAGTPVTIIAHKMALNTPWNLEHTIVLDDDLGGIYTHEFNTRVANFENYNCSYETGYYCAYYVS